MLSGDGGFSALDAAHGKVLGPKVSPKSSSRALLLAMLDADGKLTAPPIATVELDWARTDRQPSVNLDDIRAPQPYNILWTFSPPHS